MLEARSFIVGGKPSTFETNRLNGTQRLGALGAPELGAPRAGFSPCRNKSYQVNLIQIDLEVTSRASLRRSTSTGRNRPRPVRRSGRPSGAAGDA